MNFDKEPDARGQMLRVLATAPGAVKDFQTLSNKEFTFFMSKK